MVRAFWFHKMLGISWLGEQLLGSQEGPCSIRTVYMVHILLFISVALISAGGGQNKHDSEKITTILNELYPLARCGALLWIQHSTQS
jgi:hypothetical protein